LHRRCELWQLLSIFTDYTIFTLSVKIAEDMNMPDPQIERLLDLIQRTGLDFHVTDGVKVGRGREVDCAVTSLDGSLSFAVERKIELNAGNVWGVVHLVEALELPLVLVADRSTEAARSVLKEHGVGYLDATGNANVALPGIYVQTDSSHKAPKARTTPTTRLRGKAGLVVQALLIEPDLDWGVSFLAESSGVSVGLAHNVLARLEREDIAVSEGRGPQRVRRVVEPGALLDLWAEENDDRSNRTTAFVLARSSEQLAKRTAELLGGAGIGYSLTGSAAAALVAPLATSIPTVRIWVSRADPTEGILNEIGAERVESGFNLALDTSKDDVALRFPTTRAGMNIVNPFRLYVDLLADPQRGIEQAKHLREEVIGW